MKKLIVMLILLMAFGLWAVEVQINDAQNQIRLIQSGHDYTRLEMTLGSFEREEVQIDGQSWYLPSLKKAGITLEAGYPQVPVLAASVIIPPTAKMEMNLIESEYIDLDMQIAPSKGNLTRDLDPATIPFEFGEIYSGNQIWPAKTAYLTEPFILRDYRGITVRFQPFIYYPDQKITRIFTKIVVDIVANGTDNINLLSAAKNSYAPEFSGIYENMFLNFNAAKYPSLDEEGRILVIKHSMFDDAIAPWVEWKRQIGFTVDVVDVTVAGPTANNIKTFVQNQYNLNAGLKYLQIMGDAPQVPSLSSSGGGSDPSYALLAGNDNYPDIYVGRFSAQTVAEMETQVARSVHYERDIQANESWLIRGMGIASNEGGGGQGDNGESDQQHMEIIRNQLLNFGFSSVDQMYQTMGATAAQVATNVNNGRSYINYVGHGSDTSWVTTGFSNSNVNALTNDNMLPFIISVACVNGNFVSQTCFAEAWLRAKNNDTGNPTGAIGMYASTVNQSWAPPMRCQDEVADLYVAEAKNTVGGLCFNGSSKMTEVYGNNGFNEFKNWHIFGDASLMVRNKVPTTMIAVYEPVLLIGMSSLEVQSEAGAKMTLSADGVIYGKATADAAGNAIINLDILPVEPMDLTLTIVAFNKVTHLGIVQVLPADGAYIIITGVEVNENQPVNFGETINIQVNMQNVGNDPAENVLIYLESDDPYLNIIDDSETISGIAANAYASTQTGISLQVQAFVPDQYEAFYTVKVELADGETFNKTFSIILNAPELSWGYFQVDDSMGNSNNRIDPGETFILSIPFTNVGHAASPEALTTLIINGGSHVINPIVNEFSNLGVGESFSMVNEVSISALVEPGTNITITAMASLGEYTMMHSYVVPVGILLESFENGFGNLPWTFFGSSWTTESGGYLSPMAAKSPNIGHFQSSSMQVSLYTPVEGIVSFWKRVSSESGRDFFRFYINETLKNQWSGVDENWTQASYIVNAGTNTYRWEYVKDSSVSEGEDCVWIDEIVFPAENTDMGTPILFLEENNLDFGNADVGSELILPFTIGNTGTANLIGTLEIPEPYSLDSSQEEPLRFMTFSVPPQETMEISIAFRPTMEGVFAANMILTSDDPNAQQINIHLMASATPVSNENELNPLVTLLNGNYPNPFNPSTSINFSMKEAGHVSLEIYNILGQKVRTLVNQDLAAGMHQINWNGRDDNQRPVASGIYFYKMNATNYQATKKMILMK